MRRFRNLLILVISLGFSMSALAFDHQHSLWDQLLEDHVVTIRGGASTEVDYAGIRNDRERLDRYLSSLSEVTEANYQAWTGKQQLAFLINAYNAFTVELILREYPDLESIKDLGGLFSSPWGKDFFRLRGEKRTLDEVEHEMIRVEFNEPRIHMAVNCASIGCPALAEEAYQAERLDQQLDHAVKRFLGDEQRNRYLPENQSFAVSSIFKWYGDDWNADSGYPNGVRGFLWQYREEFDPAPEDRQMALNASVRFLDYDWELNDTDN